MKNWLPLAYDHEMASVKIQYFYDDRRYHINSSLKYLLALFCFTLIICEQSMYLVCI
jgi:hypothetical protein